MDNGDRRLEGVGNLSDGVVFVHLKHFEVVKSLVPELPGFEVNRAFNKGLERSLDNCECFNQNNRSVFRQAHVLRDIFPDARIFPVEAILSLVNIHELLKAVLVLCPLLVSYNFFHDALVALRKLGRAAVLEVFFDKLGFSLAQLEALFRAEQWGWAVFQRAQLEFAPVILLGVGTIKVVNS